MLTLGELRREYERRFLLRGRPDSHDAAAPQAMHKPATQLQLSKTAKPGHQQAAIPLTKVFNAQESTIVFHLRLAIGQRTRACRCMLLDRRRRWAHDRRQARLLQVTMRCCRRACLRRECQPTCHRCWPCGHWRADGILRERRRTPLLFVESKALAATVAQGRRHGPVPKHGVLGRGRVGRILETGRVRDARRTRLIPCDRCPQRRWVDRTIYSRLLLVFRRRRQLLVLGLNE